MSIKLLLVDDDPSFLEQAEAYLESIEQEMQIQTISSAEKALERIDEENFDVIVSDYQMTGMDGLRFLKEIREERHEKIPFIMFTSKGREEVAMKALNLGADRYLQKGGDPKSQYGLLANAIEQEVKHRGTEKILELTNYSVEKASPEIYWITPEGEFTYVNETVAERLGYSKKELKDMHIWDLDPDHGKDIREERWELLKEKGALNFESEHQTKEGEVYPVEITSQYIEHGGEEYEFAFARDITERKKREQELKRKERYIDHTPEYITVVGKEGEIKYHSYPSNDILELDPSKFMGSDAMEFVHPDDRDETLDMFCKLLENPREEHEMELRGKAKDGWIWFEVRGVNYLDDPEIEGIIVTAQDISKRKEAEENLEEGKNRIEKLHETSAELQTFDSKEEAYSFAIEAAEDIFDFEMCAIHIPEEDEMKAVAISSEFSEVASSKNKPLPIDDSIAGKTFLQKRSFIVKDMEENEEVNPTSDDFESGISVSIGENAAFQAVSTEVDHFDEEDLKMTELLMRHVSEALDRIQANQREEFLHSLLRHDVGNKNQVIDGYLELISEYDHPDEVKKFVDEAKKAVKENEEMIEKVRKLRKIGEEEEIDEFELRSVMDKVLSEYRDQMREKSINLDMDELDITVQGGALLEELFSNLIENSIYHSNCDEINISSRTEEDECVVSVEDDGKGISDEMKDKIFEKGFKRGKTAGTGLGLYIVNEIVDNYGGSIEVKDSDLGGACFDIRLEKISTENED